MGSVITYDLECPNCKQNSVFEDFYYKSGEYFKSCDKCGYYHKAFLKRSENGEFVKINKDKPYTYDNLVAEEKVCLNPYGAYSVQHSNGSRGFGTLENREQYDHFVSEIVSFTNQPNDIVRVNVSRYVDGNFEAELVYENHNPLKDENNEPF
jgi:hypothetical protein